MDNIAAFVLGVVILIFVPIWVWGKSEMLKKVWESLLGDRKLVKKATEVKGKIKTSGDGYEIIQNPF